MFAWRAVERGAELPGDVAAAFDRFMRGVCGETYREIIEGRLGAAGFKKAIGESTYFFRDEVRATFEFQFGPDEAARIRQPVLCIEGGSQPAHLKEMSGQISRRTVELLPQTELVIIPHVNHALPLQDPDAVARAIASFVRLITWVRPRDDMQAVQRTVIRRRGRDASSF